MLRDNEAATGAGERPALTVLTRRVAPVTKRGGTADHGGQAASFCPTQEEKHPMKLQGLVLS